jgi:F420H(2)-dependent quinone reductase
MEEVSMAGKRDRAPWLPPRWFIRLAWYTHRGLYRVTWGRVGLWRARGNRWGTLRLTTTGRRTGQSRSVIVGYFEDGPNLVTLAMNGWGEGEPAWWLNLQAHPDARIDLVDGPRVVHAHAAAGDERARLWDRWREIDAHLDDYAALRSAETAVVVLEPQPMG